MAIKKIIAQINKCLQIFVVVFLSSCSLGIVNGDNASLGMHDFDAQEQNLVQTTVDTNEEEELLPSITPSMNLVQTEVIKEDIKDFACSINDEGVIENEALRNFYLGWLDNGWPVAYVEYENINNPIYGCIYPQKTINADSNGYGVSYYFDTFLPEQIIRLYVDNIDNLIGYHYSKEFNKMIVQEKVNIDQRNFLELWLVDFGKQSKELILSSSDENIGVIIPNTVTWIDENLIFIDFPWYDWIDYFIYLDSKELRPLFDLCRLGAVTRIKFSPDTENVLVLIPDSDNYIYSKYFVPYLLSTSQFLENLNTCQVQDSNDVVKNTETIVNNHQGKLPIQIYSVDTDDAYVSIYWDASGDSIYYIDRDQNSPNFGDLVKFHIHNNSKESVLEFENFEHIMGDRSYYQKFVISPDSAMVVFIYEYAIKEVFLLKE